MATRQSKSTSGFSDAEKAAMRERAKELKAEARAGDKRRKGEEALRAAIAEMPAADRELAEQLHAIVTKAAPQLYPKTWYGMPAWANDEGKAICFFKAAAKFDGRYAEFGFNEQALLDDGNAWPTVFAVTKITRPIEQQFRALVTKAVGG